MNIEVLKKNGQLRVYKQGDVICYEDADGEYVYLLLKGKAEIYKKVGENQADKYINDIRLGTFFGIASLIEGSKRKSSVVAGFDNTIVLEIESPKFKLLLREEPDLAFVVLRALLYRINLVMDDLLAVDPAFIYSCRMSDIYKMVSSLDNEMFKEVVRENSEYSITALKELSDMLDSLVQRKLS